MVRSDGMGMGPSCRQLLDGVADGEFRGCGLLVTALQASLLKQQTLTRVGFVWHGSRRGRGGGGQGRRTVSTQTWSIRKDVVDVDSLFDQHISFMAPSRFILCRKGLEFPSGFLPVSIHRKVVCFVANQITLLRHVIVPLL